MVVIQMLYLRSGEYISALLETCKYQTIQNRNGHGLVPTQRHAIYKYMEKCHYPENRVCRSVVHLHEQ